MVTDHPLVSVVIPTYNYGHFLKAALESVQAQTNPHWEAIIVDNFSDDNTLKVIEKFNDPVRFRVVNFRNKGVIAASRNVGIGEARGQYIAFLDSDDVWKPEKLARCIESLQMGHDVVCHGEVWVYKNGYRKRVTYGPTTAASYEGLLFRRNCMSPSATVIRKAVLAQMGGFSEDPEFVTAEDWELWLRVARANYRFFFISDMLGEFRIHGTNASGAGVKHMNAVLAVLDLHFARDTHWDVWSKLKRRRRRSYAVADGAWALKQAGDYRSAIRHVAKAMKLWPLNGKAYAVGLLTIQALVKAFVTGPLSQNSDT